MLSWVFFAQPVGQLLANVLSLAAVEAYRPWITEKVHYCEPQDDECFRAIDRLWRLVVGIGIIPAVIALAFRFTIPESPRYTLDILQHPQKTLQDTVDFYPVAEGHPEQGSAQRLAQTRLSTRIASLMGDRATRISIAQLRYRSFHLGTRTLCRRWLPGQMQSNSSSLKETGNIS
jgi:MFS family permease